MNTVRDPFEWWYSASEIARRLGVDPRSIKRWAAAGQFGDTRCTIAGQLHIPWSGVAKFLGVEVSMPPASHGFRARTVGELRRQVDAAQLAKGESQ